jgi:prepilin-type processing-associated H-X9-DG protein
MVCYAEEHNSYIPRRGQGVKEISKINRPGDWFNALPVCIGFESYYDRAEKNDLPVIDSKHGQDLFICPGARLTESTYFLPLAMNMYLSPWIRPNPHRMIEIRQPATLVFMADSPGPYSATIPSEKPYDVEDRHNGFANLIMLDGHVENFSGTTLGCGIGIPAYSPVRWDTRTTGVNQIFFNNAD